MQHDHQNSTGTPPTPSHNLLWNCPLVDHLILHKFSYHFPEKSLVNPFPNGLLIIILCVSAILWKVDHFGVHQFNSDYHCIDIARRTFEFQSFLLNFVAFSLDNDKPNWLGGWLLSIDSFPIPTANCRYC